MTPPPPGPLPDLGTSAPDAASPRRLLLIVNPSAAGGRTLRLLPDVSAALARGGAAVEVATTRSLGHAAELTVRAAANDQVAVAFGGDGLVGRVAGAAVGCGAVVAALPGGRGNDFLRCLGVPLDPVLAAVAFAGSVERSLDLGRVGERYFVGIASVGFDSEVQVIANRTRLISGSSVYTYGALRTVATWRPARFSVELDGVALEHVGWSVAAANSAFYGGGMRYAPTAALDDGQLDVVLAGRSSRSHFLRQLPRVFAGTHVDDPHVQVRRARRLVIDADRPFQLYADGDPIADLPAEILVAPGALRMLVPVTARPLAARPFPLSQKSDKY